MPKRRTVVNSTGPVKATTTSKTSNVKPAWTGMIKPPKSDVSPTKSYVFESDENDEDDEDFLNKYSASPQKSVSSTYSNRQKSGFSLKNSLDQLNLSDNSNNLHNFFGSHRRQESPKSFKESINNRARRSRFGPLEPRVSDEFEKLMLSGNYINFAQLVILLGHANNNEHAEEILVRDILIWLDCFMLYVSIIGTAFPGRITSMMHYSRIILWIYRESTDVSAWWRYDKAFRRMASRKGEFEFSHVLCDLVPIW